MLQEPELAAFVLVIAAASVSILAILTTMQQQQRRSASASSVREPPTKMMISPSQQVTPTGGHNQLKRARKAAAKLRLAQQDLETQITVADSANDDAVVPAIPPKAAGAPAAAGVHKSPKPSLSRRTIGANWQQAMAASAAPAAVGGGGRPTKKPVRAEHPTPPKRLPVNSKGISITKYLSMDCEMVGVGFAGKKHMLARCSIVNQMGEVLIDRFVRPYEPVIDYRTEVSGIRPADIANGDEFKRVQAEVAALLEGRILVGHAVYNDLKVLALQHPPKAIRDTSRYRPLIQRITGGSTPSLKTLARCVLDVNIQAGEHSSVEDARAAMRIYNKYQEEWERAARRRNN